MQSFVQLLPTALPSANSIAPWYQRTTKRRGVRLTHPISGRSPRCHVQECPLGDEGEPGTARDPRLILMPMQRRKIPVFDAAVLTALEAGISQRALAAEYGVTRTPVAEAARRQRQLQAEVATSKHARHLERRRARSCGKTPHASRAPEHGPPASAIRSTSGRSAKKATGGDHKIILLDRYTWEPIASGTNDG